MNYQIKNRFSKLVIFETEAGSLKEAVEIAAANSASLKSADLTELKRLASLATPGPWKADGGDA